MTYKPQITTETISVPTELIPHAEGHESLELVIRRELTQGDRRRLADLKGSGRSMDDVCAAYAPFIVAWNYEGESPPAEGGAGQLELLPTDVIVWIAQQVNQHINAASDMGVHLAMDPPTSTTPPPPTAA